MSKGASKGTGNGAPLGNSNNPNIAEHGKDTRFKKGPRTAEQKEAIRRGMQKRGAIRQIASKILYSKPAMPEEMVEQLKGKLGIDMADGDMMTNAAVLLFRLLNNANNGDANAIIQLFEMTGQPVSAKSFAERERLEIERERLKLEREKLELMRAQGNTSEDELPQIVIERSGADAADDQG